MPNGVEDIYGNCNNHKINLVSDVFYLEIVQIFDVIDRKDHQNWHGMNEIIAQKEAVFKLN